MELAQSETHLTWSKSDLNLVSLVQILRAIHMTPQDIFIQGARGVMVIVVGNGQDDEESSNPGRDWLHFT